LERHFWKKEEAIAPANKTEAIAFIGEHRLGAHLSARYEVLRVSGVKVRAVYLKVSGRIRIPDPNFS